MQWATAVAVFYSEESDEIDFNNDRREVGNSLHRLSLPPTDDLYQLVQASHGIVFFLCVKYIAMIHSTRNTMFPNPLPLSL